MELNITIPPFPGKWRGPARATPAQENWLRQHFPVNRSVDVARAMGLGIRALSYAARYFRLKKSEEHIHRMLTVRYDAPGRRERGRRVMEEYWRQVREGERMKPVETLKQRDSEKYAEYCRKMSENMKARIRTKKFRQRMGLHTNDRIQATLNPYTRPESTRRSNALRRGYVLHPDHSEQGGHRFVIYYDEETPRNKRFEENSIKAGFSIRPWDE